MRYRQEWKNVKKAAALRGSSLWLANDPQIPFAVIVK